MAFRRIERSIAVAVILLFSMILNYARSENAFDHVYAPYSGFRIVEKDGKQGLIDGSGQTIIPCEYDALSFADFGTIRVVKNNAWGLFDLDGNVLLHPVYNYISQHVDAVDSIWFGYAVYMDTEKMGYLYFDHVLTDMIYDRLAISDPFPEDYNNVVFKDVHGANQYSDPGIGRYINALLPNDIVFETGSGQWTVDDTVSGEGAIPDFDFGESPWYAYGDSVSSVAISEGVTRIGAYAFLDFNHMTSIELPASVNSIETNPMKNPCFTNCSSLVNIRVAGSSEVYDTLDGILYSKDMKTLVCCPAGKTDVTIPNGVTCIGQGAFYSCQDLTAISLPDSIRRIGDYAFDFCWRIPEIVLPQELIEIGKYAFAYCDSIAGSFVIPDHVTTIDDFAFIGCASLTSISIPASVTSIGYDIVSGCRNLGDISVASGNQSYTSRNGILYNKAVSKLLRCPETKADVTIESSVSEIDDFAFMGCGALTSVTIPNGVTSIGYEAFDNCSGLRSVFVPNSIVQIAPYAFMRCDHLADVYYDGTQNQWNSIYICEGNDQLDIAAIHYLLNVVASGTCWQVDDDTGDISDNAVWTLYDYGLLEIMCHGEFRWTDEFTYSDQVASVRIVDDGQGVTGIGILAFQGFTNLTDITIPDSVTHIGEYAFSGCNKLEHITLPAGLEEISSSVFDGCDRLSTISIAESNAIFTTIGNVICLKQPCTLYIVPSSAMNGNDWSFTMVIFAQCN